MANKRIFSQEEIDQILFEFDQGKTLDRLQKDFHTRKIRNILVENNREIKRGGKREGSGPKYKYHFNENYFEQIDTEEKAYWLGFIYADGHISKRKQGQAALIIGLGEEEPLIKFRDVINSNKPIEKGTCTNSYNNTISNFYRFTIISNKIVNDIEKLGVVERKSLILTFPMWLEEKYVPHFIRGYFDGDGSVFKSRTTLNSEILGTEQFLLELQKRLTFLNKNRVFKDSRENVKCYRLRLTSLKDTLNLYYYMYPNCSNNFLSRKKEKFENFIKEKGSTTIITNPIN